MTTPDVRVESAKKLTESLPSSFAEACAAAGVKGGNIETLWAAAIGGFTLTSETALQLKGGRELLATEYEAALRANPAGEVAYPKGQNPDIDAAVELAVASRFPRPTKTVRNEIVVNGCTVWFSVDDDSYVVESIESGARAVGSAAAAAAMCDSGAGADALYPDVAALRDTPTVIVPADDSRTEMK